MASIHMTHDVLVYMNCIQSQDESEQLILILRHYFIAIQEYLIDNSPIDS